VVNGVFLPDRESCLEYLRKVARWSEMPSLWVFEATQEWIHRERSSEVSLPELRLSMTSRRQYLSIINSLSRRMFYILREMENKSTLQISKDLGRKYDSVLAFVREVQEIAEKIEEE